MEESEVVEKVNQLKRHLEKYLERDGVREKVFFIELNSSG